MSGGAATQRQSGWKEHFSKKEDIIVGNIVRLKLLQGTQYFDITFKILKLCKYKYMKVSAHLSPIDHQCLLLGVFCF